MARWSNGTGRGALSAAQRPVPLLFGSARFGVGGWREVAEAAVRPDYVVIVFPERQNLSCVRERAEQRLVQQLVAEAAVEALHKCILSRFAGRNVVPLDLMLLRPAQHRYAGELGAVVGNDHCRAAADSDDGVKFAHDPQAGQ